MRPIRLELHNFLAYQEPGPILFDGLNVACLSGQNGAGKSSLLDAITWALWKRARARDDGDLVHLGQTEMRVTFDFRHDGTLYRVERKYSKKGRGQSTLTLQAQDNGVWQTLGDSVRDTQAQITQLLRLDYETFVNSAFIQQGKADSFTAQTPARRKTILADILGLERWTIYEERAKARLQEIASSLDVIKASIEDKLLDEAREPEVRGALEVARQRLEAAQEALQAAEARYDEVKDAPAQMQAAESHLKAAQRRVQDLQADLKQITRERDEWARRAETYTRLIDDRERIEDGFARLELTRQICDEFGEKSDRYNAIQQERDDLKRQLDMARTEFETHARAFERRVKEAEQEVAEGGALAAELAEVRAELDALALRKAERDHVQAANETLEKEKEVLGAQNKVLRQEMDDLKERLDMLGSAHEAFCPVCHQPLDEVQRADLAKQYQAEGEARRDAYRANEQRIKQIAQETSSREALIREIDKDLKRLDKTQKREGVLQTRLEAVQKTEQRLNAARAELEQVGQVLAGDAYNPELRAEIERLNGEIEQTGYDRAAHTRARSDLKTLAIFDDQNRDLQSALEALPGVEIAIQNAETRYQQQAGLLAQEQGAAAALEQEIVALQERVKEANQRKAEMDRSRSAERRASEELIVCQQQLNAIEAARRRRLELQAERERLRQDEAVYEQLREAFGKNGVPAMIIEAAIPELEETANELLARMTDGRMHLYFDTQREKKSGGVIETLDIKIGDELGTRDYDMFSGGESFRVDFALRVALSQFLAHRAGARLQTLVIDEGFGSQDSVGRERLVEAINAIRDEFDLILIVTHIDELRDAFPAHIEVRKTPAGSVVSVR